MRDSVSDSTVFELVIELSNKSSHTGPQSARVVVLRMWVLAVDEFRDDSERCGEKIPEAMQTAWLEEAAY